MFVAVFVAKTSTNYNDYYNFERRKKETGRTKYIIRAGSECPDFKLQKSTKLDVKKKRRMNF